MSKKANQENKRKYRLFFTGMTMGLADLIPGVSGGTIAFLFGIYDELLYTIKLLTSKFPKLILKGQFKKAIKLVPFTFIIPLGLGIFVSIFGLVQIITYLLSYYPTYIWAFFFGLVIGSVYVISKRIDMWNYKRILLFIIGFLSIYMLIGLPNFGGSNSLIAVFSTGIVAITAMILPGISGSLIMVLLGQYEIVINAVASRDVLTLSVFAAGAILGLAMFVRILSWLLKNYHMAVIASLIGIMAGSLRRVWPWQLEDSLGNSSNYMPSLEINLLLPMLLMVTGFVVVIYLEKIGIAKEHIDIDTKEFNKEFAELENKK